MRVLNFGSLNIDYVYQVDHFVQPGETMSAASLRINCGGKGLNQSVALARAAEKGMRVALNAAPANGRLEGLPLERLRWLLVNEVEGAFLAGTGDPEEIARVLTRRYPHTMLVLTLGVQGSLAALGEKMVRMPARQVTAVDTTAAGDTFTGYFLRGVLEGWPLEETLGLAAAASALAVTRVGAADAVPSYEEALAFYRT